MSINNITVSVVIPCYKSESFISRAVESCLKQENICVDIIVVEDGVFDNTQKKLEVYEDKIRLYSLSSNMGACYARNYGLKKTMSDYVVFLDADDFFESNILKGMYDQLSIKGASVAFSKVLRKSALRENCGEFIPPDSEDCLDVICRMISGYAGPPPCGVMWRKSEIIRIGAWNESYTKNQDGELIVRAMFEGCKPVANECGQAIYWQHSGERVSSRINSKAFFDQERLEIYIQNQIENDKIKYNAISPYLNGYRFGVMLRAASKSNINERENWKKKISNVKFYNIKFFSIKKYIGFIFYTVFGMRALLFILKTLKKEIV